MRARLTFTDLNGAVMSVAADWQFTSTTAQATKLTGPLQGQTLHLYAVGRADVTRVEVPLVDDEVRKYGTTKWQPSDWPVAS